MSSLSDYLLSATGDVVVSSVNPFITQLTTSNSNINGATFTPALGDWIYYLFWDPTATYTVTPPSAVSSLNFVVVGSGSGGNAGSEQFGIANSNDVGITLAGGSSGAVCAGSVSVNTSNYTITVAEGGSGSNKGNNPPSAGTSSSIVAVDGGTISCSGGSPALNVTGIAGTVSTTSSNDLSSIIIPSQNNSNNTPSFGIGGTDVNSSSNANINGGPGLSIKFADSLGPFLFCGGGGGGNDYENASGSTQGGNGSNGLGGLGGNGIFVKKSKDGSSGSGPGGGGGGVINIINTQYIGSAQNGGSGTDTNGGLGGNGGSANVGGGGGGGGTVDNGNGGQGGNGLVMIYYQIPSTTTISNGLTIKSMVGSMTISVEGTGTQSNTRSILPAQYALHFADSDNQTSGVWLDSTDCHGGFHAPHDVRLQKDVAPMKKTLEQLLKLNPISFKMDNSNKLHAGFSDDNMSDTFPSVMSTGKYVEAINDNVQGVNMTALMPMVVKSIQELNTELKTKVDTLNATVKTLNTELNTVKQNNDKLKVEDVVDFAKNLWSKYKNKK